MMDEGTERKTITPARREISYLEVLYRKNNIIISNITFCKQNALGVDLAQFI